jgi:hypothetical protein
MSPSRLKILELPTYPATSFSPQARTDGRFAMATTRSFDSKGIVFRLSKNGADKIRTTSARPMISHLFMPFDAIQRSAHRWRPATSLRIGRAQRRAAIRWSAGFDPVLIEAPRSGEGVLGRLAIPSKLEKLLGAALAE